MGRADRAAATARFCSRNTRGVQLAASGDGRFCAVSSVHGLVASPFKAGYVSAKHGVLGLVKTIALEGAGVGITATAICPGYVRTPLVEAQVADQARVYGVSEEQVWRR